MCQEEIQGEKGVGNKGMTEQRERESGRKIYRNYVEDPLKLVAPSLVYYSLKLTTLEQFRTDIFEHMVINYIYKLIEAM